MNINISNLISGIMVMSLGALFLILSFGINTSSSELFDAAFLPQVYTILLIAFGLVITVNAFNKRNDERGENNYRGPVLAMITMIIYIFLIPVTGYYLATFLMILSFLLLVKFKHKILLIIVPIIGILLIYLIFDLLLNVPIPMGLLFQ
ncbi:tripartite tricarboxylate transporter TctB family protein [Salinicoccus roseus]|uniref:tripartite tricarboxylate transporter TctB family protein n=1 Tax=Salinicoccus roseus TaxID=45670 RepID=UPI001EF48137|nr:tripartite tricarboxylate transporter TctB family protein [Salinicoccus roseus]MCG7331896.1 tripartite tricarboxylate transporter TctB family protein [Salinicoccus roseus]